jgi:hypothetical protein
MPVRTVSAGRVAAVALVGVTAWAAAACSSSAPPSATAGPSPASATAPVGVAGTGGAAANAASTSECANAPSTLVGKDLNLAVGKLTATAEGPVTVCAYTGRYEVLVRYQTGETSAEFTQARTSQAGLHQAVGTVKGLGSAAYLASYTATKPFSYTLGALQGDIAIFITSPASLGAESALMTDLLKKT